MTGEAARRAWFGLIRVYGEPRRDRPSGASASPRTPSILAGLPYYAYHPFGVERRRADLIRRVASRAAWFEAIADLPLAEAYARLTAVPGIGPWTAAEVGVRALGDVDAVSVGDFHLPNLVAYALAREPRGTDARMLELLEPYRGPTGARRPAPRAERDLGAALRPAAVAPADRGSLGRRVDSRNRATASANVATVSGVHGVRTAMTWSAPAAGVRPKARGDLVRRPGQERALVVGIRRPGRPRHPGSAPRSRP